MGRSCPPSFRAKDSESTSCSDAEDVQGSPAASPTNKAEGDASLRIQSVGSARHGEGRCKPCAFLYREGEGCANGAACLYCHLCPKGEIRRRKKEKLRTWRDRRWLKKLLAPLGLTKQGAFTLPGSPSGGAGAGDSPGARNRKVDFPTFGSAQLANYRGSFLAMNRIKGSS